MTTQEIVTHILSSRLPSEDLSRISRAVHEASKSNRRLITAANSLSLCERDKVRLKGLAPRVLNGTVCEIVEMRNTKCQVKLPVDFRFGRRSGAVVGVPLSCVEKV